MRAARARRRAGERAFLAVSPAAAGRLPGARPRRPADRVPALRALRDAFPEHRLVLAAPAALAPLAALSGAVDDVLDTAPLAVPALHGAGRRGQPARPRPAEPPRGPRRTAAADDRVRRARGAVARAGVAGARARGGALVPVARGVGHRRRPESPRPAAACGPGTPRSGGRDNGGAGAVAGADGAGAAAGATVIHPGAASPARRWPADRWAAVARAERAAGRRVVVTGSPAERALAQQVARDAELEPEAVLAGRTDLLQLAAVVAAAGRVLCGDTGVAHLATAFGIPSVLLFGPTPPSEWGPPSGAHAPRRAAPRRTRRSARRLPRSGPARDRRRRRARGDAGPFPCRKRG